jgi:RND family efflux transporter MFP subunit
MIKKISITIVILVIIVFTYFLVFQKKDTEAIYATTIIKRANIVQTVSETGTVKSDSEINLSFENSGKLIRKHANIGDNVKKDFILAEIDHENLKIRKNEASANLNLIKLELDKLLAGATEEDRAISMANLQQANSAYMSAKKEMTKTTLLVNENIAQAEKTLKDLESKTAGDITSVEQAITVAENNLANTKSTYQKIINDSIDSAITISENKIASADISLDAIDQIVNNDDYENVYGVKKSSIIATSKHDYLLANNFQTAVKKHLSDARDNNSEQNVVTLVSAVQEYLNLVFNSSQSCFYALEESITSSSFLQSTLDSLKSTVSTQQTIITAAISAVETSKQGLNTAILNYDSNASSATEALAQARAAYSDALINAKNILTTTNASGQQQITSAQSRIDATLRALELAEVQKNKTTASANRHDVALLRARIAQAEISINSILNNIDKCFIKAPIDGTITKFNYEVGEQTTIGAPVISILGENNFKIEVLVSEADIAKVNTNDPVEISLDSYGDDIKFKGKIFFIEPAETEIQDVIYYKIKINFETKKYIIKSGMTANVVITTDSRHDIITVPSRAIVDNGNGKFVKVLNAGVIDEKAIEIGLRGDGGLVEIISGLNIGEKIITYTKTDK